MISKVSVFLLITTCAFVQAYPAFDFGDEQYSPYVVRGFVDKNARPPRSVVYLPEELGEENAYFRLHQPISLGTRPRRSIQPGAPQVPQQSDKWILKPSVGRNDEGNTIANVDLKHNTKDFDFDGGWNKVVNGPGKAKPTWHAEATIRF